MASAGRHLKNCQPQKVCENLLDIERDYRIIACQDVLKRVGMAWDMPTVLHDRTVFSIGEALTKVGLSRSTYFRWIRIGRVRDTEFKDRNGHRVFTEEEIEALDRIANELKQSSAQQRLGFGGTHV